MKKLLTILLALTLVISLAACGTAGPGGETESQPLPEETTQAISPEDTTGEPNEEGMMRFTVTVVHADGSSKDLTYETADKYVGSVLAEAGLIKGNDGPYGLEITEVDGETAIYDTDKAYWAVYVGDEYALTGIDQVPVEDGGVYKLEYTRA